MKIYTKIILNKNNLLIKEEYFEYNGPLAAAGIHYNFKNTTHFKLPSSKFQVPSFPFSCCLLLFGGWWSQCSV